MLDLIEERNRDFMKATAAVLRRLRRAGLKRVSLKQLSEIAAAEEAPRYYVTEEYAMRVLSVIRRGKNCLPGGRRGAMFRELNEKVRQMEESKGLSMRHALYFVLEYSKASSFFISEPTAVRLAQRILSKSKKNTLTY